ncbi:unnamed protein product [Trichobilharzia regenti]|nr:unnamed protein product [Trichobilharzia regenti]
MHEIVFCFNEHSKLINCPVEYANDLQKYVCTLSERAEIDHSRQIDKQIPCGDSFIVPAYKMPAAPTEDTLSSSSSNIFATIWNWFWRR